MHDVVDMNVGLFDEDSDVYRRYDTVDRLNAKD